jgi:hypothetical protein
VQFLGLGRKGQIGVELALDKELQRLDLGPADQGEVFLRVEPD